MKLNPASPKPNNARLPGSGTEMVEAGEKFANTATLSVVISANLKVIPRSLTLFGPGAVPLMIGPAYIK